MLHPAYTLAPDPPEDPDEADRLLDLQRELDAERRAGRGSDTRPQPSAERRAAGPAGGTPPEGFLPPRRPVERRWTGRRPPSPGRSAAPSSAALPDDFATLADRRYLGRVARVIPPRARPYNFETEGL